jgi:hypothetical protein
MDERTDQAGAPPAPPSDAEWRSYVERRFAEGDARMGKIEESIKDNTTLTREIRDWLAAARKGMTVLGWLGELARWIGGFAAMAAAIWSLVTSARHGAPPK